jgi:hypothetical protein
MSNTNQTSMTTWEALLLGSILLDNRAYQVNQSVRFEHDPARIATLLNHARRCKEAGKILAALAKGERAGRRGATLNDLPEAAWANELP